MTRIARAASIVLALTAPVAGLAPMPAPAQTEATQSPVDRVLATLETRGYRILLQERTFFGRVRIIAENAEHRREMVINPGTGEMLRDYAVALPRGTMPKLDGNGSGTPAAAGVATSGGTGDVSVSSASGGTDAPRDTTAGVAEMPEVGSTGGIVVPDPIIAD